MRPEEADHALAQLLACFEHQPISAVQREQWTRYLATLSEPAFTAALEHCAHRGGSAFSPQKGRRPGVAEFAGIVASLAADRQRQAQDAMRAERWPAKDPEATRRHVEAIKRANGLR